MFQEICLDNNLKVIFLKNEDIYTVNIGIFIGAGSNNENSFQNYGCAHFLEHMMFKGNASFSAKKIAEIIDDLGGYGNAYTSSEYTVFYNKVVREDASLALDLFYNMLFKNNFDEDEIKKEKDIIIEEINMYEDEPSSFIVEEFSKNLFKGSGLGNAILGEKKYVQKINKGILEDFHRRYYNPNNIILAVAGNYDDVLLDYIKEKFGKLENKNEVEKKALDIKINDFNFKFYEKEKLSQVYFTLGGEALSKNDENYYKMILFNNLLGGNSSSYLFQRLREDLSCCYDISSFVTGFKETGELVITGGVNEDKFTLSLEEIFLILDSLKNKGVAEEIFNRGKQQLKRQLIMSLDNMRNLMFSFGIDIIYFGKPKEIGDIIRDIELIEYEEFNYFVKEYLGNRKLNLCILASKKELRDTGKEMIDEYNKDKNIL